MNVKNKYSNTIEALVDVLGKSDGQSIDDVKADLESDGIDVERAMSRFKVKQKQISLESRRSELDRARNDRSKLVEKGQKYVGRFRDWTKGQLLRRIHELSGSEAGLAYRNLESMGTEEMASILEDLEMTHDVFSKNDIDHE